MIERNGSQRTLLCDLCDDLFDQVSQHEFTSMIAQARDEGWTIQQQGDGSWGHHCSRCKAPGRVEQQRALLAKR